MRAKPVLDRTFTPTKNASCVLKAWEVHHDKRFPDNFKYSFVLLYENKRVLAYDNHEGKGHHRHHFEQEEPNPYIEEIKSKSDLEKLAKKFMTEVTTILSQIKKP